MYQSIISEVPSGSDKSIEEILMELGHALKVVGGNITYVHMYAACNLGIIVNI